jgi:hypothetical protein
MDTSKKTRAKKIELILSIQSMDERQFNDLLKRIEGKQIAHPDPFSKIRENANILPDEPITNN